AARHLESRRLICRITALNNGKFYSRHRVIALVLRQQMNKEVLCSYSAGASDQFGRRRTNLASARKFITQHPALRQIPGIDLIPPFWRHTWLGQPASRAHRETHHPVAPLRCLYWYSIQYIARRSQRALPSPR